MNLRTRRDRLRLKRPVDKKSVLKKWLIAAVGLALIALGALFGPRLWSSWSLFFPQTESAKFEDRGPSEERTDGRTEPPSSTAVNSLAPVPDQEPEEPEAAAEPESALEPTASQPETAQEETIPEKTQDALTRPDVVVVSPRLTGPIPDKEFDKKQLSEMIGARPFTPDDIHSFEIKDDEGHSLFVRTTLDPKLQAWAVDLMPKVKARSAALVVINPENGEVLTMASYRSDGQPVNLALASSFPAASLFKIVTAAAALEKKKFNSESTVAYDGGKHTLYKGNLKGKIDQGRHQVTLRESFADSINTVFGKLGAFTLGPKALENFAQRFYFNQPIEFEMAVQKSQFQTAEKEDTFRLAELASGFNRTTKLSPLHGAMLASAIINDGTLMEPTVVKEVFDRDNTIYYQHEPVSLGLVVSSKTVKELRKLMRATMVEGTGQRRFGDAGRHKVLSKLDIGGKSGTINNDEGHRVDWFVCFARRKGTNQAIGLAAVVVHNPKLGVRSQEIIRLAIINYFQPRLGAPAPANPDKHSKDYVDPAKLRSMEEGGE